MREIQTTGSVRVDLVGGTLDLEPLGLIIAQTVTLNVATSLKAEVKIQEISFAGIEIFSLDYKKEERITVDELHSIAIYQEKKFGAFSLVIQILDFFNLKKNIRLELASGSPAGSGLGGSSAMGVTLYKALCEYTHKKFEETQAITVVRNIEARILNGPAGYQDFYPALYGGVLALEPKAYGVKRTQLFSSHLKKVLEENITLVYSGKTRNSGINNWEVYKAFFDGKKEVVTGLTRIAEISQRAYQAIITQEWESLLSLISEEGEVREKLFTGIMTSEMRTLYLELKKINDRIGIKVCGAGGGGCFLIIHPFLSLKDKELIHVLIQKHSMQTLPFCIEAPLTTSADVRE